MPPTHLFKTECTTLHPVTDSAPPPGLSLLLAQDNFSGLLLCPKLLFQDDKV